MYTSHGQVSRVVIRVAAVVGNRSHMGKIFQLPYYYGDPFGTSIQTMDTSAVGVWVTLHSKVSVFWLIQWWYNYLNILHAMQLGCLIPERPCLWSLLHELSFLNQACVAFPRTPCARPARTRMIVMNTAGKPPQNLQDQIVGPATDSGKTWQKIFPFLDFHGEGALRRWQEESTPDSWLTRPAQPLQVPCRRRRRSVTGEETGRFPAFPRTTWSQSHRVRGARLPLYRLSVVPGMTGSHRGDLLVVAAWAWLASSRPGSLRCGATKGTACTVAAPARRTPRGETARSVRLAPATLNSQHEPNRIFFFAFLRGAQDKPTRPINCGLEGSESLLAQTQSAIQLARAWPMSDFLKKKKTAQEWIFSKSDFCIFKCT